MYTHIKTQYKDQFGRHLKQGAKLVTAEFLDQVLAGLELGGITEADLVAALAGKADLLHQHGIADVTGLAQAILDVQTAIAERAEIGHQHEMADVPGLNSALTGKADVDHEHEMADVVGLPAALADITADLGGIHHAFLADFARFARTLPANVVITNGNTFEFLGAAAIRNVDRDPRGPVALYDPDAVGAMLPIINDVSAGLVFPTPPNPSESCLLTLRVVFEVDTGSDQYFTVQLRRVVDNSVVAESRASRHQDSGKNTIVFPSFIYEAADPFVAGGLKVTLANHSGSTITLLPSISILVQWTHLRLPDGPFTLPGGGGAVAALAGWSPIFAIVADGVRRVLQIVDWTMGGGGVKPALGYVGPLGIVADIADAVDIRGPAAAIPSTSIASFTTVGSTTWVKPVGPNGEQPVLHKILIMGGGAGGGSGRRRNGAAATTAYGGGGGGGGGFIEFDVVDAAMPLTAPVVVGAGGVGGAPQTVNDTNGLPGTAGGLSAFNTIFHADGGGVGVAGGTAAASTGARANTTESGMTNGATEGLGGGGAGGVAAGAAGGSGTGRGAGGGGGGAGFAASVSTLATGGAGGVGAGTLRGTVSTAGAGGPGGAAGGGNGTAGGVSITGGFPLALAGASGGGGGGTANAGISGGNGGNGGNFGAGGGGGAASMSANSGAGGNGGQGFVVVISYF